MISNRLSKLPRCSHLGSSDAKLFVDSKDVASRLGDPTSGLADLWKKTELQKFADKVENPPSYSLSSEGGGTYTRP